MVKSHHTTTTLQITGMGCASCVGTVEAALNALLGIDQAQVNFSSETAQVNPDAPLAYMTTTLSDRGYPMATQDTQLTFDGLNWASRVSRVKRALLAEPGVISANVNLATETASIAFAAGATGPTALAAAVSRAGQSARSPSDAPEVTHRKDQDIQSLARQTLFAALLALPVFVLEMGGHMIPAFHHWSQATIGQQTNQLIQFAVTSVILVGPGRMFHATGLLPAGTANVYFEAAAAIVVLILFGRLLEARAKGRTDTAIQKLIGLHPETALI